MQGYNCQAMVDSTHQAIVAARATNQSTDVHQAAAMIREAIENVGAVPREMSADAGYYSAPVVQEVEGLGVEAFIAPDRTRHGKKMPPAPRGRIPADLSPRDRMRRKLRTKRGRGRYALRMHSTLLIGEARARSATGKCAALLQEYVGYIERVYCLRIHNGQPSLLPFAHEISGPSAVGISGTSPELAAIPIQQGLPSRSRQMILPTCLCRAIEERVGAWCTRGQP